MAKNSHRKLAAILAADVVAYSRLMGADESGTLTRLKAHRNEFIHPKITEHHGRIVKLMGDGALVEFGSVVDALACAIDIQRGMAERNRDESEDRRIAFRIGINLGDVMIEGDDIYGDGVNVAARLEGLAAPGGICISESVHMAVGTKLPLDYEDLGEQQVKNIAQPVRAYRAELKAGASLPQPASATPAAPRKLWTAWVGTAAVVVVVIGGGLLTWLKPWQPREEPASVERMAFPLPDKPSIAVLPFDNMSDDADQEYFVDGMTEDLITDLSKISGLFVISRNSSFAYKGEPMNVRRVSEELGVRYVMEGSVRRVGNEVRINAQLIDAATGGHLWAERYDGTLSDIFSLQDQVIARIVAALKIALTDTEQAQLARIPTHNLEAYDYYLRAERSVHQWGSEGRRETLKLYRKAITLDLRFADAYAGIAWAAFKVWRWDQTSVLPPPVARKVAYKMASKALELDPDNAQAYSVLAYLQVADGEYDEALESIQKAVLLHPNDAEVYTNLAGVLVYAGRHAEALSAMDTAFRLEPIPPPVFHADLGWVLFWNRQYEKAIGPLEKGLEGGVEWWEDLAMTYSKLGRREEAKAMIDKMQQEFPGASLAYYRAASIFKRAEDLEHHLDALREAGLPEWPLGYAAPAGDRLDTASVEALTLDRTWVGKDVANGGTFVLEFGPDRAVAFRGSDSLVVGTAWVEDGMLCIDFPALGVARESCSYLYRNPKGTPEEQNEYVRLGLYEILTFSIRP